MSLVPPATGINFSSWWVVNVIFNGIIKRRKPAWWSKYSKSCSIPAKTLTDSLRLRSVCCPRLWRRRGHCHHFLLHHASCRPIAMVGEHRPSQDRRRVGNTLETFTAFRVFRAAEGNMGVDRFLRIYEFMIMKPHTRSTNW